MTTYYITEKQNQESVRQGKTVECKDLAAAKRHATKNQCFHGTVLTIETSELGNMLAVKKDGKWQTKKELGDHPAHSTKTINIG